MSFPSVGPGSDHHAAPFQSQLTCSPLWALWQVGVDGTRPGVLSSAAAAPTLLPGPCPSCTGLPALSILRLGKGFFPGESLLLLNGGWAHARALPGCSSRQSCKHSFAGCSPSTRTCWLPSGCGDQLSLFWHQFSLFSPRFGSWAPFTPRPFKRRTDQGGSFQPC